MEEKTSIEQKNVFVPRELVKEGEAKSYADILTLEEDSLFEEII